MKTLTEILNANLSDKGTTFGEAHGYSTTYEKWFSPIRDAPIRLLEIGICDPRKHGASLVSWYEYFPSARIFGIDVVHAEEFNNDRIVTFVGDQSNRMDLGVFIALHGNEPFDIVIDDGSHDDAHQQISLGYLFKHVKAGGMYIIEDMHVSPRTVELLDTIEVVNESQAMLPSEREYLFKYASPAEFTENRKMARIVHK